MRKFQGALDQDHSVVPTEPQIGDEQVNLLSLEHIHRATNILRDIGVVLILEQTPQSIARMLLVIDDQDGGLKRVHGWN